ncbi:outer membrane beta-barrel protein [Methyloligella sp. 2.7D]|uniref:outer membrane beta-barrel protein n=1 Tax=unclassified Methyloligella TaxID=2625955 RepID=UPI00157DD1CE|nr:outer membrane beta-barrel protein [Methyloligella sp. GL2]QKP76756.1 outer membrane beta-barrel protein [Methyloligella sp. GL2]
MPSTAQTADSVALRGAVGVETADAGEELGSRRDTPFGAAPSAATYPQPVANPDALSGAGSAPPPSNQALNSGLGDVGEVRTGPPLGGMGDETGGQQQPQAAGENPFGDRQTPFPGGGTTRSEADRILQSAAQRATGRREAPPLSPLAPAAGEVSFDPYAPIGTRIGSFLLYSELTSNIITTDNVFATRGDQRSDWGPELKPDIRLESNWSRHFLSFNVNATRSWYQNYPSEDTKDLQGLLKGRIDIRSRTNLAFELEKSKSQDGRNAEDLPDANVARSDLDEQHASLALDHRFNRLTSTVTGTATQYDYNDVILLSGTSAAADDRDYLERELRLRNAYELQPDLTLFVDTAINDRDYTQGRSTSGGFLRGSDGYRLLSGAAFRVGGKISGEIGLGYGKQTPVDNRLTEVSGFLFDADVLWQVTGLTALSFQARTDLNETSASDASGVFSRFFGATLTHNLRDNIILGGYVSYDTADYIGQNLTDDRYREGVTAEYLFNRNMALVAAYEHTNYVSSSSTGDYEANEVTVGMRLRK